MFLKIKDLESILDKGLRVLCAISILDKGVLMMN